MVDNTDLILPLLTFDSEEDFYYLQILQRKKENELLNSNSRVVKNYYIYSAQYLMDRMDEIRGLCDLFNARASIRLNRRNSRIVALKTFQVLSGQTINQDWKSAKAAYDRACGQNHNEKKKRWILDFDDNISLSDGSVLFDQMQKRIKPIRPEGNSLLALIPSKSGIHIISNPFDLKAFEVYKKEFPEFSLHKDNPTNLYIPD